MYVHIHSNHPPNVIKEIPNSINARLNSISCNKQTFDEASPSYQEALQKSGHAHTLTYSEKKQVDKQKEQATKKKKRRIIWFNPPYNQTVHTNIGKCFLALLDKHFPPQHPLRKVINRNCVKMSYSCTKNMKTIIQSHNNKILKDANNTEQNSQEKAKKACNCRVKTNCVVNNQCQVGPVVYRATIGTNTQDKKTYIGCTENFKARYSNHKASFKHTSKKNDTVLSQHIWNKGLAPDPDISWEIITHAQTYKKGNKYCDLCTTEKVYISKEFRLPTCLNKRTDLTNSCIHKAKHKLSKFMARTQKNRKQ